MHKNKNCSNLNSGRGSSPRLNLSSISLSLAAVSTGLAPPNIEEFAAGTSASPSAGEGLDLGCNLSLGRVLTSAAPPRVEEKIIRNSLYC